MRASWWAIALFASTAAGCMTEEAGVCLSIPDTGEECPSAEAVDRQLMGATDRCDRPGRVLRKTQSNQTGADTGDRLCCYTVTTEDAVSADCSTGGKR
ncbi:MAG: hypothetical protein AAFV53_32095 [Myxococcota bacterium]